MTLPRAGPPTGGWISSSLASPPLNRHLLDYNSAVFKVLKRGKRDRTGGPAPDKYLENVGLIVIVILILAITLTRYWHNIHWSAR